MFMFCARRLSFPCGPRKKKLLSSPNSPEAYLRRCRRSSALAGSTCTLTGCDDSEKSQTIASPDSYGGPGNAVPGKSLPAPALNCPMVWAGSGPIAMMPLTELNIARATFSGCTVTSAALDNSFGMVRLAEASVDGHQGGASPTVIQCR